MCGFAGFLGCSSLHDQVGDSSVLKRMADAIAHRGPDDSGFWLDRERFFGLAHRRLSIVDLSVAGHQPMQSASARYVIAYNGEIYNNLEIRDELERGSGLQGRDGYTAGHWKGRSDTETLLAGFDSWGIFRTVEQAIGMFAFAVWDRQTNTLTLGRDRLGEKPLYFGWQGDIFLFGSELKSLKVHPAFKGEIDRGALSLYMRHNYIPAPYSIYKGISKLQPGSLLTVSLARREPKVVSYWSAVQVAERGVSVSHRLSGAEGQALDELEALLRDSVRQQMTAEVPLGAFLSGGIDSSTVVALMQAQSPRPVKTFSIGFNEAGYNEAVHAKEVAKYLGTEHTELYVTAEQARAVIPHLSTLYDEPFADSSQIPSYLVSRLARGHVKVALSGDGGDELFCGYSRYQMTLNVWRKLVNVPLPLRKLAARGITRVSPQVWTRLASAFALLFPSSLQISTAGDKLSKAAGLLESQSIQSLYLGLVSHWRDPASVVIGGYEPATLLTGNLPPLRGLDEIQCMMALDMLTYLPDDNLTKVDRAAMGVSLETRVPFLDHRVVEFAWSLPQSMKLRSGQTKWALRQVLHRYVPKELIDRPKMGFSLPLQDWLRGPLRDWAEVLIDEARLRHEGFFHHAPIRQKWAEHLSGNRNWATQLWNVLMFQAWVENQAAPLSNTE